MRGIFIIAAIPVVVALASLALEWLEGNSPTQRGR